jgi:hypothetical protein
MNGSEVMGNAAHEFTCVGERDELVVPGNRRAGHHTGIDARRGDAMKVSVTV